MTAELWLFARHAASGPRSSRHDRKRRLDCATSSARISAIKQPRRAYSKIRCTPGRDATLNLISIPDWSGSNIHCTGFHMAGKNSDRNGQRLVVVAFVHNTSSGRKFALGGCGHIFLARGALGRRSI